MASDFSWHERADEKSPCSHDAPPSILWPTEASADLGRSAVALTSASAFFARLRNLASNPTASKQAEINRQAFGHVLNAAARSSAAKMPRLFQVRRTPLHE